MSRDETSEKLVLIGHRSILSLVLQDQWTSSEDLPQFVEHMLHPEPKCKSRSRSSKQAKESCCAEAVSDIDSVNSSLMQLTANIKRLLSEPI